MYEVDYRGVKIKCYFSNVENFEATTFEVKRLADELLSEHEKDVDYERVKEIRFEAREETREYALNDRMLERETYIVIEATATFNVGDISIPFNAEDIPRPSEFLNSWRVTEVDVRDMDIEVDITFKKSFKVKSEQLLFKDLYFRGEKHGKT